MSWPQWTSGTQPPAVPPVLNPTTPIINPAPAVVPPNLQYTPDQWAQMQQQNWNQWAQWQQQYQQWHQQYGAEYQKSMNALAQAAQQTAPVPNQAPPPLPVEPKPPLPTEDPPPPTPSYSTLPPQPNSANNNNYSTTPQSSSNYNTAPSSSSSNNYNSNQHASNNYNTAPPFQNKFNAGNNYNQSNSRDFQKNQQWQNQGRNFNPQGVKRGFEQQGSDYGGGKRQFGNNKQEWQPPVKSQTQNPPPRRENTEELSEAEKKFDKQFADWESQFNKWKEQNAEHPDKEQYKEYEKKWETWRAQLLERREQMRRKRLGLADLPKTRPLSGQGFNQPFPKPGFSPGNKPMSSPVSSFNKPPPNMNNEPLSFKANQIEDSGGDFLKTSGASGGIPGLDLVKDDPKPEKTDDVVVIDSDKPESVNKGPDFDAISKGINNILGDPKLMNMLSMVSQNQSLKVDDNVTTSVSRIKDSSLDTSNLSKGFPEQSNQSFDEHSNISEMHGMRESVNNFDDQTRSSFTHNEAEPRFDAPMRNQNQFYGRFEKGRRFEAPEYDRFDEFPADNQSRFQPPPNQEQYPPEEDEFYQDQDQDQDRFVPPNQGCDDFGPVQDRFGPNEDRFPLNQNRFGSNQNRFGPSQDRFGNNQDTFRQNQNRFDRYDQNEDRFNSRFGPNQGRFGPGRDRFEPPSDKFGHNQDRFGQGHGNSRFVPPQQQNRQMQNSGGNMRQFDPQDDFDNFENCDPDNNYDDGADFENKNDSWQCEEKIDDVPEPPQVPAVEEEILKPATVIDYEHKSLVKPDIEILIEPIHMFDYRHKPLSRIPLPQRPKWLSETVKYIREFDPPIVRQFEPPNLRRYPLPSENWRNERLPPPRSGGFSEFDDLKPQKKSSWSPPDNWRREGRFQQEQKKLFPPVSGLEFEENISEPEWDDDNEPPHKQESNITFPSVAAKSKAVLIEDILNPPGRYNRPPRIVIILRGPPGSGKTYLAKLIKDKEVENGGSAPRILSLDDYFMVEQEKEITEEGKKVKIKNMVYEYEAEMEESYRLSLIKSFKKTITDGYFSFIIVDNVNDKVKYFGEMWSFAKQNGFQVYICQMDLDVQTCSKRNVHDRTEADIAKCVDDWEPTPSHHPVLDATSLLQSASIPEVEMEEVNSPESDDCDNDGSEDQVARSKWDNFDCSMHNLAKLDGLSKPLRASTRTMEEYLRLDSDWTPVKFTKPGQKRVRWADLEEKKQQEKMRAIGFVVGQTNWDRMMDPTEGGSALTQTKYIEKTGRQRVPQK